MFAGVFASWAAMCSMPTRPRVRSSNRERPGLGKSSKISAKRYCARGELDRPKLGGIVFADEQKRQLLNSIVHPLVIEAQNAWLTDA